MKHLWHIVLLLVLALLTLGWTTSQGQTRVQPNAAAAPVQSLYTQVVAIHPIGIPKPGDMKSIASYLSQNLLHRIDLAKACQADFFRQNPRSDLKPAFEWLELGLFSGGDEQASPTAFQIERTQLGKDGIVRVYVKLTYNEPSPYSPWIWHVAAVVIQENGQYVVDDVIYLNDEKRSADERLSERLSAGCDGPRWVGYGNQQKGQQP
jgi:hypothetical protein